MRAFAIVVNDRGEDRCIALFSQKFRARNFYQFLRKSEPGSNARIVESEIDGGLYIPFKSYMEREENKRV